MVDIRVTGLVKSFDLEKRILDGLSFQVDSGERVGLLGRNGAGKTTVFRMLTGELEPDEGEVQIAAGRRVGLISQIPVYPEGYTVEDVLQTAFARGQRRGYAAAVRRAERQIRGTGRLGHGDGGEQGGQRPEHPEGNAAAGIRVFVRRREDPGEPGTAHSGGYGHPAAGRAHEPSGPAGHGVAGGVSAEVPGHGADHQP